MEDYEVTITDHIRVECSPKVAAMIRPSLSYKKEYYREGIYHKERKETIIPVIFPIKGSSNFFFYAGSLNRVLDVCESKGYPLKVVNKHPKLPTRPINMDAVRKVAPYLREEQWASQERLVLNAKKKQRGILKAPTGVGKTVMGIAFLTSIMDNHIRVVWLCHTKSLTNQAYEEIIKSGFHNVGRLGDNYRELDKKILVATRQSYVNEFPCDTPTQTCDLFDAIIVDECFPKATAVATPKGYAAIETLQKGDLVYTKTGVQKIIQTFKEKKSLNRIVKINFKNKRPIFCSSNHLFMTDTGWTPAAELKGKHLLDISNNSLYVMLNSTDNERKTEYEKVAEKESCLPCMPRRVFSARKKHKETLFNEVLPQKWPGWTKTKRKTDEIIQMSLLPKGEENSYSPKTPKILFNELSASIQRKDLPYMWNIFFLQTEKILFQKVCLSRSKTKANQFYNYEQYKQRQERYNFRENEKVQSVSKAWCNRKTNSIKANKWNSIYFKKRGKWDRSFPNRITTDDFIGEHLEKQLCSKNILKSECRQNPPSLQNRFSTPNIKNCHRIRRLESLESKRTRHKKRKQTEGTRVESVEIYKPGSSNKSFSSIINNKERNKGFVEFYDLEVEKDHSYFVEGVLVHNCHHVSSFEGEYGRILRANLADVRIGLTATLPEEGTEAFLTCEGLIGPVIGEITMKEGQDKGFLAEPEVRIRKIPRESSIKDIRKYSDVYDAAIVFREARHRIIADIVKSHVDVGESVLILIVIIDHGTQLMTYINALNIPVEFVHGTTESHAREEIKTALNNKGIHCVVSSVVFREGINIPELNVIINAAGGKSEIATIQGIGRGLRRTPTKSKLIYYDFFDESHTFLIDHFGVRYSLFHEMGWIK